MTILFLLAGPVIAIIIVLTIIQRRKARHKAAFASKLNALTSNNGLALDLFEQFNNRLIGLDHQQGKLLFIEFNGNDWNFNMFHVDQIKACAVLRSPIGLQCHMDDGSIITLPFYSPHTDKFYDATALTRKAAYWRRKINGMLTKHEEPEFF